MYCLRFYVILTFLSPMKVISLVSERRLLYTHNSMKEIVFCFVTLSQCRNVLSLRCTGVLMDDMMLSADIYCDTCDILPLECLNIQLQRVERTFMLVSNASIHIKGRMKSHVLARWMKYWTFWLISLVHWEQKNVGTWIINLLGFELKYLK